MTRAYAPLDPDTGLIDEAYLPAAAAGAGQVISYPTSFDGSDTIDGSSATPFVNVSAFDTKEVLNSRIVHLQTKGASKDQSVRLTLGTTKAGAFDVRVMLAASLLAWSHVDGNTYADVLLRTSAHSTICGARLQGANEALASSGLHWPHIRPKVGGSSFAGWDDNLDPSYAFGERMLLRFVRDGSNVITFWAGHGSRPITVAKRRIRSNYEPYTATQSGTLAEIDFAIHTPSGPGSAVEYDLWIDYVQNT